MSILLVDDDPSTLNALRIGLISHGFDVTVARSGEEALNILRTSEARVGGVRLLITDYRMPQMDGLRLIKAARALLPDLGTILITGYGSEGLREEAERIGVSAYLEKPFTPHTLARQTTRVLEGATDSGLHPPERPTPSRPQ